MTENEFKPIVKEVMKKFGMECKDIPLQNNKTPDLEIVGQKDKYLLELKIKGDDPVEIENDRKALKEGEMVTKSIPLAPRNRLSAIIEDAIDQLNGFDSGHNNFHIIWIHCTGKNSEFLAERFYSTIFGTQKLVSLKKPNIITCYYFTESCFFTFRNDVEAILLSHEENNALSLRLCINNLSPNSKKFRESELFLNIPQGIRDPSILETTENAMIADCDFDRNEENSIIEYLRNKYKLKHLQTIDLKQHSAMVAVPKESN